MTRSMQVTWQVLLEDDDWSAAESGAVLPLLAPRSTLHSRRRGVALWVSLTLVALLGWTQFNRFSHVQIEQDIVQAATQSLAPSAESVLRVAAEDIVFVDLRGEQAMVQIRISDPAEPGVWRENRFFAQTDAGWKAVEPLGLFWGVHLQSTSALFRFSYQQRDAATVEAVRVQLDSGYAALRRDLGLQPRPATAKVFVRVLAPGEQSGGQIGDEWTVSVPSPGLLRLPETVTEADALLCAVWVPLVKQTVDEAIKTPTVAGSWRLSSALEKGVRLWGEGIGCATTADTQREALQALFASKRGKPSLGELVPGLYDFPYRGESLAQVEQDALVFATLLAYSKRAYGSGRLPYLLAVVSEPVTWQELIPTVYDVSAEEFEVGWRAWLVDVYGVEWVSVDSHADFVTPERKCR